MNKVPIPVPVAPVPPVRPAINDCCRSGCIPCVFDLYEEQLARYQIALAEYQQQASQASASA